VGDERRFARGWSSIVVLVTFLGGANMLVTGVLGVYVGRIYSEVKRRPLYVVEREVGFAAAAQSAQRDDRRQRRA
jgi:polyisoprenyl-phosphate glycosyltransferase